MKQVYRIWKEYRHGELAGVIDTDVVSFSSFEDAMKFQRSVNANPRIHYSIISIERERVEGGGHAIVKNPTGGYEGKL